MSDEPKTLPAGSYPSPFLPVAFSDGVKSISWGRGVVKFYLYRNDPDLEAQGGGLDQPVAQVVMPTRAFVGAALFFERTIEAMIADGVIKPEELEEARKLSVPK